MDGEALGPQREERAAVRVLELLPVGEGEGRALAADDFDVVLVCDIEGVPREGPDLLLQHQRGLLGEAVRRIHAEGGLYRCEMDLCHCLLLRGRLILVLKADWSSNCNRG